MVFTLRAAHYVYPEDAVSRPDVLDVIQARNGSPRENDVDVQQHEEGRQRLNTTIKRMQINSPSLTLSDSNANVYLYKEKPLEKASD